MFWVCYEPGPKSSIRMAVCRMAHLRSCGMEAPKRHAALAWVRMTSGIVMFAWLELLIWRPQAAHLNYLFDVGAIMFAAGIFVKPRPSTLD